MADELKTYTVVIPMAGHLIVTVQAKDEAEAKDKAFDEADLYRQRTRLRPKTKPSMRLI